MAQKIWKANALTISEMDVRLSTRELNTAKVTVSTPIADGTHVSLTLNTVEFFNGYVVERNDMADGKYDIQIAEYAKKLYNVYCFSPAVKGIFKPSLIIKNKNPTTGELTPISAYMTAICETFNHSGITVTPVDVDSIGSTTVIPNMDLPLPDLAISHQTLGKTLQKFVVDTLGLSLWYTYNSSTSFNANYGTKRSTITLNLNTEPIVSNRCTEESIEETVTGVYLINSDQSKKGFAGEYVNGSCSVYQIETSYSEKELNAMSAKILADRSIPRLTYDVDFPLGTVRFKEGDIFDGLGDQTLPDSFEMTWKDDSDPWQIEAVKITTKGTTVTVK